MKSTIDILLHNTILIQVLNEIDEIVSTGTGFTYAYRFNTAENHHYLALITNKHVLENAKKIKLTVPLADDNNNPIIGENHVIIIKESSLNNVFYHPTSDLAMINISNFYNVAERDNNIKLHVQAISKDWFITENDLKTLTALEEIVMIGYPKGLWDSKNNLPLLRKGITASHPSYDFNGKPEFLIDAACFPGSSGSPVYLYNTGSYFNTVTGEWDFNLRVKFIGILYSGPTAYSDGIVLDDQELISGERVVLKTMLNLGHVIKASEIFAFNPVFEKLWELRNSKTSGTQ